MTRNKYISGVLILAAAVFIIFGKSLPYEFLAWDDDVLITNNPAIKSFSASNIREMCSGKLGLVIPFVYLSFAADNYFYGLDPWGFRLTNLILHALNMGLVFYLFSFFVDSRKYSQKQLWIVGVAVALIWGIHPLRVESVVWITERKDVLSGFFCLLSLIFYLQYASSSASEDSHLKTNDSRHNQWKKHLSIWLYLFALLSKPSVLPYPLVLVLLDFYPLARLKFASGFTSQFINCCREKWLYVTLSVCAVALTFFTTISANALAPIDFYPITYRITNAIYSLPLYLYNTICPITLLPYYPKQNLSLLNPLIVCTLALYVFVLYTLLQMALKKSRYWGIVIFGVCIAMLFPMLGFYQVGTHGAADRYTYLATIPFFFWLGSGLLHKRYNKWIWIGFVIWCTLLAAKTIEQQNIWKDSEIFLTTYTETSTEALGLINLGIYYSEQKQFEKAEVCFRECIKRNPTDYKAYNSLGVLFAQNEFYEEAIEAYKRALSIQPDFDVTCYNLGNVYRQLGRYQEAQDMLTRAIQINPGLKQAYKNLGNVFFDRKLYDDAILAYKHLISLAPDDSGAYHNLGNTYSALGRYQEAEGMLIKALQLNPGKKESRELLAQIRSKLK